MRHLRAVTATALAACVGGIVLLPTPAQAAGSVHISKIYYDSPGRDTRTNASLNAEYVQIRNTTRAAVSLKDWSVTDGSNHRYVFGAFTLGKGKTVTIRTGKGTNNATTRYQGRTNYVWNNDRDTATLKRASGSKADTCSYNSTRVDSTNC
ncbi:lamin tail domain-containing protein [Streptomyces clavuligerus]|nr:lamin tail domain-containing protein [Streptomyces clavuligerus]ANW21730.1 hypothetical protein BB341_00050 [Streptomyces clavuligerus]AXU16361.1 lamin tail domain-containing protein [Streptomyces clavuligerus]MBY6301060.1 lamin tail domain-containing protein [Streptomyces clavuligerus]QCS09144.1 hypothetical protein CRV15_00060 [Streptomyces clavuligerus]QPJ96492.1 lamin tail domain-containing protein [Streptomyces clavuligerus]